MLDKKRQVTFDRSDKESCALAIIEMVRQVVFHSLDDIEIKPTGLI